jgi:hypothetical protein
MAISYCFLIRGKEYYIETKDLRKFKGMFFEDFMSPFGIVNLDEDISITNAWFTRDGFYHVFYTNDKYYDAEEIRYNSQKAREQMEQRALNKILKRIVNEEFEWY